MTTNESAPPLVRDWVCSCGHTFTAPIRPAGPGCPNLSNEATAWCPKCGKRPAQGSASRELRYKVGEKRILISDQCDDDENGNPRTTPAGEVVEIIGLIDSNTDNPFSVGCPATGATFFFNEQELDAQTTGEKPKFDREQLLFIVDTILTAALDRLEAMTPPGGMVAYCEGVLDTAGMALAVLYYRTTGDGIAIQDALTLAGGFAASTAERTTPAQIRKHSLDFVNALSRQPDAG